MKLLLNDIDKYKIDKIHFRKKEVLNLKDISYDKSIA